MTKGATIWNFFLFAILKNDPPYHFYCIFMWQFLPKIIIPVYFQDSSLEVLEKSCFLKFFYPPQIFFAATRNSKIATLATYSHF